MSDVTVPQILYDFSGYLLTLICAWVAVELRLMRKEISLRVHKEDCKDDMGCLSKRIETVEMLSNQNKTDIALIKACTDFES